VTFRSNTSRVAGPRTLRCAPVADYSSLDTWLSPLPADCSAFCFVHPMLPTDLTRRSTLDARRRLRIAPLPATCVRAVHRIAPCSTLKALHRSRIAPLSMLVRHASCELLRSPRFAPCRPSRINPPGLLQSDRSSFGDLMLRDGLRIAPYADTSHPCVDHGSLRVQHFKLRPVHRLLCARRLAPGSNRGLLRCLHRASWCCPRIAPCTTLGVLRLTRLAPHSTLITPLRIWITPYPTLDTLLRLRIAPHSSLSAPC
jgi:hypothetical protein